MIDALLNSGRSAVQVIILGAGLDTLALRLQKQRKEQARHISIFEMDSGEPRDTKLFALSRLSMMRAHPLCHYATGATNLHFVESQLGNENWYAPLVSYKKAFNPMIPSIVVGEGLAYLSQKELSALLNTLRSEVMTPDSKLILSLSEPGYVSEQFAAHLQNEGNSNYEFALGPAHVPGFARKHHFDVEGKVFSSDLLQEVNQAMSDRLPLENYYVLGVRSPESRDKLDGLDIDAIPTLRAQVPCIS